MLGFSEIYLSHLTGVGRIVSLPIGYRILGKYRVTVAEERGGMCCSLDLTALWVCADRRTVVDGTVQLSLKETRTLCHSLQ